LFRVDFRLDVKCRVFLLFLVGYDAQMDLDRKHGRLLSHWAMESNKVMMSSSMVSRVFAGKF